MLSFKYLNAHRICSPNHPFSVSPYYSSISHSSFLCFEKKNQSSLRYLQFEGTSNRRQFPNVSCSHFSNGKQTSLRSNIIKKEIKKTFTTQNPEPITTTSTSSEISLKDHLSINLVSHLDPNNTEVLVVLMTKKEIQEYIKKKESSKVEEEENEDDSPEKEKSSFSKTKQSTESSEVVEEEKEKEENEDNYHEIPGWDQTITKQSASTVFFNVESFGNYSPPGGIKQLHLIRIASPVKLHSIRTGVNQAVLSLRDYKQTKATIILQSTPPLSSPNSSSHHHHHQNSSISSEMESIVDTVVQTIVGTEYSFDRYKSKPKNSKLDKINLLIPSLSSFSLSLKTSKASTSHLSQSVPHSPFLQKTTPTPETGSNNEAENKGTIQKENKKESLQEQQSLEEEEANHVRQVINRSHHISRCTNYARDLGNERADVANSTYLEQECVKLSENSNGLLELRILDINELKQQNLNLLLSVGQGAVVPPRLISMEYTHDISCGKYHVLVGKGITFDSGGLDKKPAGGMLKMHMDMCGAATVLGVMKYITEKKVPINVVGILALAENAVDANSYKPGAIIKSYNGMTVEVGNTDAEGRLALADAMAWAQENYNVVEMIDLATLTGACVVGLGEYCAGLFSNDQHITKSLHILGQQCFERVWPMPIYDEHTDQLESKFADICSTGDSVSGGGACVAAGFLKKFVKKKTKWAHIDIAGPAMYSKDRGFMPKGATGFGVRLLCNYLESNINQK